MGTLTSDDQSNVRRFFVRQAACSGSKVPRNTGKTLCQNWSKKGSRPALQIQKTPIYRQILERRNPKNDGQKRGQKSARNPPKWTTVLPRFLKISSANLCSYLEQFLKFPCCSFPRNEFLNFMCSLNLSKL